MSFVAYVEEYRAAAIATAGAETQLGLAGSAALRLMLKRKFTFVRACAMAADRHNVKQYYVKELVRKVIPEEYFTSREAAICRRFEAQRQGKAKQPVKANG